MFEFRRTLEFIPLNSSAILELHSSGNQPQIAAEGHQAQDARAFFVSGHGAAGIEAYIYMLMLTESTALIYQWDEPISKGNYPEIQAAGVQFTESMGFMMEDRGVRRLSPQDRDLLLADLNLLQPLPQKSSAPVIKEQSAQLDEGLVVLEASPQFLPDETILELSVDAPTTQVGYVREQRTAEGGSAGEDPLEDKNFKVFLRLLTSV